MGKRRPLALSVVLLVSIAGCASKNTAEKADVSFQGMIPASAYAYPLGDKVPEGCQHTTAVLPGCYQYRMEALYAAYKELKQRNLLE